MSKKLEVILSKSYKNLNKYMVSINKGDKSKTIHFGAKGYSDYTIHKDPDRMKRYISRHKNKENWTKSGIETKGFWSRWLLWSENNINKAIKNIQNKFNIKIKNKLSSKSTSKKSTTRKRRSTSKKPTTRKRRSTSKKSTNRKRRSTSKKSTTRKRNIK